MGDGGTHSLRAWLVLAAGAAAVVVAAVAILGGFSSGSAAPSTSTVSKVGVRSHPASASGRSPTTASAVSTALSNEQATALASVQKVSATALLADGKPEVFFMSALYCPFCAAERWALVRATARFGRWTGLTPLHSHVGVDGFGSVPTYDLLHATFTSRYITVDHKDVADENGNALQSLTTSEQALVNAYDGGGSIPFMVAGGTSVRYQVGLAYSPGLLVGRSFAVVRAAVYSNSRTPGARAINAEADALTAVICRLTAHRPSSVCRTRLIERMDHEL